MSVNHIACMGYSGTGSSAAQDILKEFDCCAQFFPNKDYEDFFLMIPDGLFDLEWKLLANNDVHRSDEALVSFLEKMEWMYTNHFNWFGDYKRYVGPEFLSIVNDFVKGITLATTDLIWYNRNIKSRFSALRYVVRFIKHYFIDEKVQINSDYVFQDRSPVLIAMPYPDEFFTAARKLVSAYLQLTSIQGKVMLHDHLIWPQQIDRISNYFDNDIRFIVVHRDLRDLFILNNYYWKPIENNFCTYPQEVGEFCDFWDRIYSQQKQTQHPQVLNLNFEDLVYCYDETTAKIMDFCELSLNQWEHKGEIFSVKKSIKNTQAFLLKEEYKNESDFILGHLPKGCYKFPFKNETSIKDMFV